MESNAIARGVLLSLALIFYMATHCNAQVDTATVPNEQNTGFPANTVHLGSDIDTVQMNNGNLHIDIPYLSVDGRGLNVTGHLVYDSKSWQPVPTCNDDGSNCYVDIEPTGYYELQPILEESSTGYDYTWTDNYDCYDGTTGNPLPYTYLTAVMIVEGNGTKHPFPSIGPWVGGHDPVTEGNMQCPTLPIGANIGYSSDGSAWYLDLSGYVNTDGQIVGIRKDGAQAFNSNPGPAFELKDTNGNYIGPGPNNGSDGIIDTLGRLIPYSAGYYDSTGAYQGLSITTESVSVQSAECPTVTVNPPVPGNGTTCFEYPIHTFSLPHIIQLPNGDTYTVEYVQKSYGQPSSITLPSGAVISYQWVTQGLWISDSGGPVLQSRTVTVDGVSSTWNYQVSGATGSVQFGDVVETSSSYLNKVTDPLGNDTTYTCASDQAYQSCVFSDVNYYSGSSTSGRLLKNVHTTWNLYAGSYATEPHAVATTLSDAGLVSQEETQWEQIAEPTQTWGPYTVGCCFTLPTGNKTQVSEYDYGVGGPGALLRTTAYQYLHQQYPGTYLPVNILDRPTLITVSDGSGQLSQTKLDYDTTTVMTPTNGTAPNHDGAYGTSFTPRGNLTQVSNWVNGSNSFITTKINTYDSYGNLRISQDANNNSTSYSYDDNFATSTGGPCFNVPGTSQQSTSPSGDTQGYVTSVTNALNQMTRRSYYPCAGVLASSTDPNGAVTSQTYDVILDPLITTYPDTGTLTRNYNGYQLPLTVTTTRSGITNAWNDVYDGLGRIARSTAPSGATTDTTYDLLGRVSSVTNPYFSTSDSTYGVTNYYYDALGRKTEQIQPDSVSHLWWCYNGVPDPLHSQSNCRSNVSSKNTGAWVDSVDEIGNDWQRTSDALGRMTSVIEPNGSVQSPSLETDYQYDPLNNLVQVDQWGGPSGSSGDRVRMFVYDALSRLTNACNPESIPTGSTCSTSGPWSDSYGYLSNGSPCSGNPALPCSKTDARGITATYTYEALNRLYTTTYSDGVTRKTYHVYDTENITIGQPAEHFTTNNVVGRLSVICVWIPNTCQSMTAFSYDAMGRVTETINNTPSNATTGAIYTVSAGYDLAGDLTSLTYPDGRVVTQNFDGAGRLAAVKYSNWNGTSVDYPYLNYTQYWPNGSLMSATFGSGTEEDFVLNNRLQPNAYSLKGSQAGFQGQLFMSKQLCYYPECNTGGSNVGNIYQITDNLDSGRTELFGYDSLNRLNGFLRADQGMEQTYLVDPFGNVDQTSPGTLQNNLSFNANNQISSSGYGYDAAGNLTAAPNLLGGTDRYTLDGEGRITGFDGAAATYTYDADGNRVHKEIGTDGVDWTEYLYFGGQPVAELKSDYGNLTWSDYIFANGKRIARSDSFDQRIHIEGTSNAAGSYAAWYLPFSSYVIQSGDKISWRQYQNGAVGGIGISFTDGTNTNWSTNDTDGQVMNSDNTEGSWHFRTVDLTPFAGKTANNLWVTADSGTPVGFWLSYFSDISIFSTNGNVIPIYYRQTRTSFSYFGGGSESNTQAVVERGNTAGDAESPWNTTTYYSADQIGSTRMLSAGGGWPVSMDSYYPFGQETIAPADNNHYKFTGKERDAESGNDYFGARYYASSMGRFLSPDWSAEAEPVPYARLDDPQSLNLYVYGGNNPLIHIDADGHCWPQWACNFFSNVGQRFGNYFNYGYFKTNSQVDTIAKQGVARLKANGYSPEGLHKSDLLRAANLGLGAKSFQTYLKHHPNLEPYAGRTSGTGTPEENVQLRDRNHHMNEQGYGEAELDKSSSNSDAIRGREQQLIEANGGAQSQGGTSGNAINGIAESNPNKGTYMGAANAEFGAVEGAETGAEETIEVIEIMNDLSDIP